MSTHFQSDLLDIYSTGFPFHRVDPEFDLPWDQIDVANQATLPATRDNQLFLPPSATEATSLEKASALSKGIADDMEYISADAVFVATQDRPSPPPFTNEQPANSPINTPPITECIINTMEHHQYYVKEQSPPPEPISRFVRIFWVE